MDAQNAKGKPSSSTFRACLGVLLFSVILGFALLLPDHPGAVSLVSFLRLPLEVPLLALTLLLLRGMWRRMAAGFVTVVCFTVLLLKVADIGTQAAFQRPFNPYLDAKMLADGWNVISGVLGNAAAFAAILALVGLLIALGILLRLAIVWMALSDGAVRQRLVIVFASVSAVGALLAIVGVPRIEANAASYLAQRLKLVARSVEDMRTFETELTAAEGQRQAPGLFSAIAGRDVILIFVESYGRSAVEDPRYAPTIQPRLQNVEAELVEAGLSSVSAWARSPTVGGLSWLAHGTLLSGLWIDSQARYDRLVRSRQASLNRLFSDHGWKSVAVMPAITRDWPEAAHFRYDEIFPAASLGYRGKPFNWITMPDQYTLSAFENSVRRPAHADGRPVMAEIALISSHAPWTPVPAMIDWNAVGDGSIFNAQAEGDAPPSVVWADAERVRQHYVRTIDYSLETIGSYISRFGGDAIFIVIGDHQPAAIVTGANASRAVPVHIVSRDTALLDRFRAAGFAEGMRPRSDTREWPMSSLRALLIDLFSDRR